MVLFPRKGDNIRAHSVFFQAGEVRDKDIGTITGMSVTRSSSSSVAIASGTYKYNNAVVTYAGGSLTGIPVASSGKHRYDIIVVDCSTSTIKRVAGSEDTPAPYEGGFLNNQYPSPPELESETQILLAVIKVTATGIPDETYGKYATGGVAFLPPLLNVTLGVTDGNSHAHTGGKGAQIDYTGLANVPSTFAPTAHASAHQSGGGDAIKLDDLAAPDDNTDLNVSTSKHGLMSKLPGGAGRLTGDGSWDTPVFTVDFIFGDGSAVLVGQGCDHKIPQASKIVAAEVTSRDVNQDLLSGSVTCTIYIFDYNGAKGSASDSFALSSASSMRETGLNIAVAAGKRIGCVISGITSCKQVNLTLDLEAT